MPNFILTGEHRDALTEANHPHQSEHHQWTEAKELIRQSESDEKHLSLTLLEREYSYKGLKSWWQNIERQIDQCASDDRRMHDCHNATTNHKSAPKECGSELQENQLGEQYGGEVGQASECELEESGHGRRRSVPEVVFLAERLQQLADTTREMAQQLLSPEAGKPRRVDTLGSQAPGVALDSEDGPGSKDLEFVRQKILLLDDVVEELSQYTLTPLALDKTDRSVGEPSESECRRNESVVPCNSASNDSTDNGGGDIPQEVEMTTSATFHTEETQNTVPNATGGFNKCPDSIQVADEDLTAAGRTEQRLGNAEVSETSDDDSRHFAADVTKDEQRTSPVRFPQRERQTSSPVNPCTSDESPQQLRFGTPHRKGEAGATQRIRPSVSKRERLDRVTTTALRLLSYPVLRHALYEVETNSTGDDAFVGQKMPLQVTHGDMARSVTESSQQEPPMNSSSFNIETSSTDLSQECGFGTCHENELMCEAGDSACQNQQQSSKPVGIDGMISLVQRLLRLQIMGHA